jgi:peptidyl-prolyl cis-trans isomerase B (cyclophilin B)
VSSRKQQREYARRRYEKWLAHQSEVKERQRRRRIVIGWVLGVLAAAALAWLVVDLVRGDEKPAQPEPAATETPQSDPGTPDLALAEGRAWTAVLHTTAGDITLELDGAAAPQAVASFVSLAGEQFFDATTCHRLTTSNIFVLQCGSPTGDGTGGPDYRFGPVENAPVDDIYPAGTVAMARIAGDAYSMGSQFFLVYEDSTIPADSAGGYTVLGRVVEGMDVLQAVADAGIAEGTAETPALEVTIQGVDVQ